MSKRILHIISSPRNVASVSRKLGNQVMDKILEKYPGSSVTERDLDKDPFPHLQEGHINAFFTPTENHSTEQTELIKYSDQAIAELQEAEIIVIDTPMYNFTITSTLKTWLDHIVRRGVTFNGRVEGTKTIIEGLLKNKKVYLAFSSSGIYSEGPMQSYDFIVPLMKAVLGWLGMTDITAFRAEGIRMVGEEAAFKKAVEEIVIA